MAIRKMSNEDDTANEFYNVLYVADPGVGKTWAMLSMAYMDLPGKIYVIDSDGLLSKALLRKLGIEDKVEVFRIDTYEDMRAIILQAEKKLAAEPGSIGGFAVDTLSELSKQFTTNLAFERFSKNTRLNKKDDQFEIDVKEHGQAVERLRFVARKMRDLPCHTVFTSHPKEDKEDDGTVYYRAGFGPKFATDITKFVHTVVFMQTEVDQDGAIRRVGYTDPYGKYRGKDNLDLLPTKMLEPSFQRIAQVARGELTSDEVDANLVKSVAETSDES